MIQGFKRSRVSRNGKGDVIQVFADRHRLKTRFDAETRFIPGKLGQIYEYGAGRLAVTVMPITPRKNLWGRTRNRLKKLGFVVVQDGDYEGTATFDPSDRDQSRAAIKAAGISRKRRLSPSQINRQLERLRGSGGEALCAPETIASQEQDSQPITPQESVPTAQTASPTELPATGDTTTDEAASPDRTQ